MAQKPESPHFKPNQLVLCRYESYPYWPATITHNFPVEVLEGYRCRLTTNEGPFYFYWCLFCNEDKGGWVREDRLLLFHPRLLRFAQVSATNSWFKEQKTAFRAACKIFNALHSKALHPKPVDLIPDLLEVYKRRDDIHESEFEHISALQVQQNQVETEIEHENGDTPATGEPSVKDETSNAESSDHPVTGKRASLPNDSSEFDDQKPAQRQRIDSMLNNSAPGVGEKRGEEAEVTFFAPPPPAECMVSLPNRSSYHSRLTNSTSFSRMMNNLSERVAAYSESSKDAEEAHHIFDVEKENIRRKYKDIFERLRQVERRAADDKQHLVIALEDILRAKVDISDLKRFRAGMKIRKVAKEYQDVPAIQSLCEEIVKLWEHVVTLFYEPH